MSFVSISFQVWVEPPRMTSKLKISQVVVSELRIVLMSRRASRKNMRLLQMLEKLHELVSRDSLETPKSRAQSRRLGCLVLRAAAPGKQFYSTPETNTVKPSDTVNHNKFSQALKLSDIAGKPDAEGRRARPGVHAMIRVIRLGPRAMDRDPGPAVAGLDLFCNEDLIPLRPARPSGPTGRPRRRAGVHYAGPLSRLPRGRGPSDGRSPFKVDHAVQGESDIESIPGIPSRKLEPWLGRPTPGSLRAGRSHTDSEWLGP